MSQYQIPLRVAGGLVRGIGIIVNCISLSYFVQRQNTGLGNRLLILLNSSDILVCVIGSVSTMTFQVYSSTESNTAYICWHISSYIFSFSYDCTGIITCLVSVTRTIKVCRPFFSISGFWTGVRFLLYFLDSFAREFTLFYFTFIEQSENMNIVKMYYSAVISSGIAACIVVAVSSIITACRLLRENKQHENISESRRYATITILILTTTFCVLNATFFSAAVISICIRLDVIKDNNFLWAYRDIIFSLTQCLNSAINPMIYLKRKREMKQFVRELWRTVKDRLSRSGDEPNEFALRMRAAVITPTNEPVENNPHIIVREPVK